jgi:hypothetical protein
MASTAPPILVEFIVDAEASEQIKDLGLKWVRSYGQNISIKTEIDADLINSVSPDDLIEHIGLSSEFLIYVNIKDSHNDL